MNEGIARRPARRWPLFVGLAILALTVFVIPVAAKSDGQSDLAGARNATASFHDLNAAKAAGYTVRVADVNGITCIDNPGERAPWASTTSTRAWSPSCSIETAAASVDASTPELLVFAPGTNGHERLVALEYLTIKGPWDAQHAAKPSLFGQTFNETARRQPVRPAAVLQPARLDLGPEPDRHVLAVEPAGDLPLAFDPNRTRTRGSSRPPRSSRAIGRTPRAGGYHRVMTDTIEDPRVIDAEAPQYNATLVRREDEIRFAGLLLGPLRRRADAIRGRPVHDHRRDGRRSDRPASVFGRVGAGGGRLGRLRVLRPPGPGRHVHAAAVAPAGRTRACG